MIVCDQRQIAIFLVPKTGTLTLHKIFKNVSVNINKHSHDNYLWFLKKYPNKSHYKMFAFYRNPLDRFLSALRFAKRSKSRYPMLLHRYYGNNIQISCISRLEYHDLDQELKDKIECIGFDWMLDHWDFKNDLAFKPQIHWLGCENLTLLDYRNYEQNVRQLLSLFEYSLDQLPVENTSIKNSNDLVTDRIKHFVESYYKDDLALLAEKL